jgi:hypothetical protein
MFMSFKPQIPVDNPRITEVDWLKIKDFKYGSTMWRRRYAGTWEIKNNKFYLVGVDGKYVMSPGNPIFADWVSDTLIITQGQCLDYCHSGFGGIFERELRITIIDGIVTDSRVVEAMDDPIYKEHLEYVAEHGNIWD